MEIKKEDLNLIAIDLLDLKFNKGDYSLLCQYLCEKLKDDGVEIEIDTTNGTGTFNGVGYNYSMESKREGIKSMVSRIIETGEDKGLSGHDTLGVWLNHGVEHMSRFILDRVTSDMIDITRYRLNSTWCAFGTEKDERLQKLNAINVYKVQEMWKRMEKNIKEVRHKFFVECNQYVY